MLENYNTLVATSLAEYKEIILRIGHMGENARIEKIINILNKIDISLKELGFDSKENLVELFNKHYK
jgi:aspartate aminotransferase-like enzyme